MNQPNLFSDPASPTTTAKGLQLLSFFQLTGPKTLPAMLLLFALFSVALGIGTPAIGHSGHTTLEGTLTIDFAPLSLSGECFGDCRVIMFRIPNKLLGEKAPKSIDGMPFRGEKFTIDLNDLNGCKNIEGVALLRLSKKHKKGSVFKSDVTAVLAKCLFDGLSFALPYDPFVDNDKASRFGEAAILLAQILEDNEGEIRSFMGISAAQSQIKIKTRNGEFALTVAAGCAGSFGVVRCNRGGTANLIANFEVRMQFQKPRN